MSYLRNLCANCIRCGNFCDESLFCDLCDKNSRHSVAELCKRYNTKLNKISQFVFDLFVELYKCCYFVNSFHRRNRKLEEKNKCNSLQTDFTALRNSQYKVMRHFASQMSLQSPIDDNSSGEEDCSSEMDTQSEDEFLCVNLAAPNRHSYGSYLSQTSSNFSTNQLKSQGSHSACPDQQYDETNGVDHNYEYIDIIAQQEQPDSRFSSLSRQDATNSESEEHEQSSASEDCRDTIMSRYHSSDVDQQPRPLQTTEGRGWIPSCLEQKEEVTSAPRDQTNHTYEVLNASPTTPNVQSGGNNGGIGGVILDLQEIDDMFNFDQSGPLSASGAIDGDKSDSLEDNDKSQFEETTKLEREVAVSTPLVTRAMRGNTHSLLLTETGDEKVQVSEPMTPQPHRRAAQNRTSPTQGGRSSAAPAVQSQFQLYSRQYANNFAPPSRPLASIRKQSTGDSSTGLFQSLARLWAKKKDSSDLSQSSETSDGILEPEFLVENTIKLYFKCMHKLHGSSLKGVECTDLRLELINKLKDLRIILEGPQADDMEEISFAINKLIILINRLFQKTLSKHEMNLIRIISQYLTKKCLESAFRMRNFRERKTELFQKLIKVLDREL